MEYESPFTRSESPGGRVLRANLETPDASFQLGAFIGRQRQRHMAPKRTGTCISQYKPLDSPHPAYPRVATWEFRLYVASVVSPVTPNKNGSAVELGESKTNDAAILHDPMEIVAGTVTWRPE